MMRKTRHANTVMGIFPTTTTTTMDATIMPTITTAAALPTTSMRNCMAAYKRCLHHAFQTLGALEKLTFGVKPMVSVCDNHAPCGTHPGGSGLGHSSGTVASTGIVGSGLIRYELTGYDECIGMELQWRPMNFCLFSTVVHHARTQVKPKENGSWFPTGMSRGGSVTLLSQALVYYREQSYYWYGLWGAMLY